MRSSSGRTSGVRALGALVLAAGLGTGCATDAVEPPVADAGGLAAVRVTDSYRYTVIDVPGASQTLAFRMNARGDLVGAYMDGTGMHGFLRRQGEYRPIDFPGAAATLVRGINERGDMVGNYVQGGRSHGFLLRDGEFIPVAVPGAFQTTAWDINARGVISGEYQAVQGGAWFGFVLRDGAFDLFQIPGATMSAGWGINLRGEVVGHYRLPNGMGGVTKMLGFVYRDGTVTQLDHPVVNGMSCAMGIGDHGAVVGHYYDLAADVVFGYVWQAGAFIAALRVPGAPDTYPTSITPNGVIAGYHYDSSWNAHGFIAEPVNRAGK